MKSGFIRPWHIAAAIIARLLWLWYFADLHGYAPLGTKDGAFILDTQSYLGSIESLLAGKGYDPDLRMPGYGAPYFLLRLVLDRDAAITGMLALNVEFGIFSSLLLGALALRLCGSRAWANAVFTIFLLSPFVVEYDHQLLTESLAASALITTVYLLVRWWTDQRAWHLVLAGVCAGWLVFLRPVCALFLPIFLLVMFSAHATTIRERLARALLFLAPFLLAECMWIARNWSVHHAFHPATNGFWEKSIEENPVFPITRLVMSYGGYWVFWDPDGDINWFMYRPLGDQGEVQPADPDDDRIPHSIFCPSFNLDSLQLIARDYHQLSYGHPSPTRYDSLRLQVAARADRYREAFMCERPFQYHVVGKLRLLKRFILHSGTERAFRYSYADMGIGGKSMKVSWAVLFIGSVLLGLITAVVWLFTRRPMIQRLLPAIALVGTLVYPLVFRFVEYRYITTTWPLLLVIAALGARTIAHRWPSHVKAEAQQAVKSPIT